MLKLTLAVVLMMWSVETSENLKSNPGRNNKRLDGKSDIIAFDVERTHS